MRSSVRRRSRPVLMVRKFVSVPPSQRLVTKNCPSARGLFLDDVLRLALGADEEHVAAAADGLDDEVVRAREEARGLVEVDDVDAVARAVDERAHLRVPALGLVAEVTAGLDEVLHADGHVARRYLVAEGHSSFTHDCSPCGLDPHRSEPPPSQRMKEPGVHV